MKLKETIEQFDPGHFARRETILEDLRAKVRELGFFPLPLSQNDVDCFRIRLEPNEWYKQFRKFQIDLSEESYFDAIERESVMSIFKRVAKYDGSNDCWKEQK